MNSPSVQAAFGRALEIMHRLRAPDGCPWDRAQSFDSIRPYTLEETYEVLEAIGERDWNGLREELGDLLLQVLFYAEMAEEAGLFDMQAVIETLNRKLVRRHPHVFESAAGERLDAAAALGRWDAVKAAEKRAAGKSDGNEDSLLRGIPAHLPALAEAAKIGERAAAAGFDWDQTAGVWDKMDEELAELRALTGAGSAPDIAAAEDEMGDILFTAVNLARRLGLEPESALKRASRKFTRRFQWMENEARRQARRLQDCSPADMDALWRQAKAASAP